MKNKDSEVSEVFNLSGESLDQIIEELFYEFLKKIVDSGEL